jgi:hypothetical protein
MMTLSMATENKHRAFTDFFRLALSFTVSVLIKPRAANSASDDRNESLRDKLPTMSSVIAVEATWAVSTTPASSAFGGVLTEPL